MAKHAPPDPQKPTVPWRRILWIAGPLLAALAIGLLVFWPSIWFQLRLGELHSDDAKVRREARERLAESDDGYVNDRLYTVLVDPEVSFYVRLQVGDVLVARQRPQLLEKALREEGLAERTAALATLFDQCSRHGEEWFVRDYGEREEFRVAETILGWLDFDRDLSRVHALRIVATLEMREALEKVRPLVRGSAEGGASSEERAVLIGAVSAIVALGDCGTLDRVVDIATNDPDDRVRFQMIQSLYRATRYSGTPCADGAFPMDRVEQVVLAGIDGPPLTRQLSLLTLAQEPEWAAKAEARLLEILDGGDAYPVRREALGALASLPGVTIARRLPRYFHVPEQYVRSQASTAARMYSRRPDKVARFDSAWIGLVRDETENKSAYETALAGLRDSAGRWLGAPAELMAPSDAARARFQTFRETLFQQGQAEGMTRAQWADAWWRWMAGELGLSAAEIDDALQLRETFWRAADAGDVAAARAALDGAARKDEGLWTYERGWLDAR